MIRPQRWAAKVIVKTDAATANHPQPRHKALSEDLLGQDAHGRGTGVGNAFSVLTWTLIWARAFVPKLAIPSSKMDKNIVKQGALIPKPDHNH